MGACPLQLPSLYQSFPLPCQMGHHTTSSHDQLQHQHLTYQLLSQLEPCLTNLRQFQTLRLSLRVGVRVKPSEGKQSQTQSGIARAMGPTAKARPESGLGVGWYGSARFVGGGTRWGWSDLLVHSVPWGYAQHRLSCFLAQFLSTKTRLLAYHQLLKPASLAHLSLLTGSRECPWPEQLSQGFTMATPKSDSPPSHQKHNCIQENQGKFSSVSPACLPGRSLTLHCPLQIHSFFFPRWLTQCNLTTFMS